MSVCKGSGGEAGLQSSDQQLSYSVTWYCVTNDVDDSVGDVLDFRT